MPRLRPVIEVKEKPPEPVRQLIEPDEDQLETPLPEPKKAKPAETEVIVEDEKADDASLALKKQIEDLRKSEEVQRNYVEQLRREREEMLRKVSDNARESLKLQRETVAQEEVAMESTLAANKADVERALVDFKNATDSGDNAAAAEAINRLAEAKANVKTLERGLEEVKERKRELKRERDKLKEARREAEKQATQQPQTGDPVDSLNLPPAEKDWLKSHREYMIDKDKAADLEYVHRRAVNRGLQPGNPEYLPFINNGLAALNAQVETPQEADQRSSMMSAPVSREVPAGNGQRPSATRVTLTKEERELAKTLDITEAEYAKQKQKLAEMRANGEYGERR